MAKLKTTYAGQPIVYRDKPTFDSKEDKARYFAEAFKVNLETGKCIPLSGSGAFVTRVQGYCYLGICARHAPRVRQWKISMKAHRLIYWLSTGELPEQIDHINGVRDDNRIENLRAATNSQNKQNGFYYKGLKGVFRNRSKRRPYLAYCQHKYLGAFRTELEAARAYDREAKRVFGEFARTNEDLGLIPSGGDRQ